MRILKADRIWNTVKQNFVTEEVFQANEIAANRLTAKSMVMCTAVLLISWVLNELGIFDANIAAFRGTAFWGSLEMLIPAGLCWYFHCKKNWLKYVMILSFTLAEARIDSLLSFNVALVMVIPIIISCRYYSADFTKQIALLTTVLFGVSAWCGAWFGIAEYNLMYQADTKAGYVRNVMLQGYLPKWMQFAMVAIACIEIARWGRRMVLEQADISQEHSRVETELEMARRIQNRALPIVHNLPRQEVPVFDLAAMMEPAKEVGGDFYDFFYLDSTHLVLMIADVSGKGVPAALFMMASKLLLDNSVASGKTPGQALAEVNRQLCEKNLENMFVTVWLGILDLENGDMVTANAGHEYPLLCKKDGTFSMVKDKHGFVLGGMEGMRYKETILHLEPGDILFVYTDGVPEANDMAHKQFGMENTIRCLNANREKTMEELLTNVKGAIDAFADRVPQFDDTTMLALRFVDYMPQKGIQTKADTASIETVEEYIRQTMQAAGVPSKPANRINIAVDEVYSNIVNYSGAVWASVNCEIADGLITVTLLDNGTPFDPTEAKEPDVSAVLDARENGGLGIYMTRKLMDTLEYRYEQRKNMLTLQLRYAAAEPDKEK